MYAFFAADFGLFFAIINLQIVNCINGLTFAKCKLMLRSDAVPQVRAVFSNCLLCTDNLFSGSWDLNPFLKGFWL